MTENVDLRIGSTISKDTVIKTVHYTFTDLRTMCGLNLDPYSPKYNPPSSIKYEKVTCLDCFELLLLQGVKKERFTILMKCLELLDDKEAET